MSGRLYSSFLILFFLKGGGGGGRWGRYAIYEYVGFESVCIITVLAVPNRQSDRQTSKTKKQINGTENITSFAKEAIRISCVIREAY